MRNPFQASEHAQSDPDLTSLYIAGLSRITPGGCLTNSCLALPTQGVKPQAFRAAAASLNAMCAASRATCSRLSRNMRRTGNGHTLGLTCSPHQDSGILSEPTIVPQEGCVSRKSSTMGFHPHTPLAG